MVAVDPLHAIRLRAWRRNQTRADELAAVVERARRAGSMSEDDRTISRALVHQLIGSTGTFGHDTVSEMLGGAHQVLDGDPASTTRSVEDLDGLHRVVERVRRLLTEEPTADEN